MKSSQYLILILFLLLISLPAQAIDDGDIPNAEILNDEGGPVIIQGEVSYTNAFFAAGTSEPLILLEDQTGFVNRDKNYLIPVASQQLGQITSDFHDSPFSYSLSLPIEPQAPLNDVDHDDEEDMGVMVFQLAYWSNTFGDAFLEERDLFGGGWSGSYSSADVSGLVETRGEYIGGKIIIYAPDNEQAFPSGFGEDMMLFTEDDPLVMVPQGYTIVDMDTEPFTFDRSHEPIIDLIEGEGAEADDFSEMSYTEAFDAMLDKFRLEYAFTDYKELDWDELYDEFYPRFEEAEDENDAALYSIALQEFLWRIPDGHVSMSLTIDTFERFATETDGGLGMAIRELDDETVIVTYLSENGPAEAAGIQIQAEITEINGIDIHEALDNVIAWSGPFSSEHIRDLQNLRYITRYPLGTEVEVTYRNPNSRREETANLVAINELDSFEFSSFNIDATGYEMPVELTVIEPYLLLSITSFLDDSRLSIQLWERILSQAITNEVPAIIIDMRSNGGGSGFLADQMAAYFFDEPLSLGNAGAYDESLGEFYFDPEGRDVFFLPPENLRYTGEVVLLVGPNCASACEFFSYDMTIQDRATIIGQYPSQGLGGGVEQFYMPDNITVQMTVARAVDTDGNIHIEGLGVAPDIYVPVTIETLFTEEDLILQSAIDYLNEELGLD
jgi:C-terminal processing protease CtpA/Prc